MRFLTLIVLAWISLELRAESPGLPQILGHSQTRVVVNRGDIVSLRLKSSSENDLIQWWLSKEKLCDGIDCRVDTGSWQAGAYKIITIVSNDKGSEFVSFYLLVKEKLNTSPPALITPDFQELEQQSSSFSEEEPYALAVQGSAFSWRDDKLYVLKTLARNLDWDEKLKSSGGTIQLGRLKQDEHFLLPGSQARLVQAEKRRLILLQEGMLRSRQLDRGNIPNWTVIVGDWLQLDGSNAADFAVEYHPRAPDQAMLYVFSGQVRIIKDPVLSEAVPPVHWQVAGTKLLVRKSKKPFLQKILPRKKVRYIFRRTTPELLFPVLEGKPRRYPGEVLGLDVKNPMKASQALLQGRDYSQALWLLQQAGEEFKTSSRWRWLQGDALGGINLGKLAIQQLKASYESVQGGAVAYSIGLRYFENNNWDKARDWFIKAADGKHFGDRQVLYYYLGVIAFRNKDFPLADRYFKESNWYAEDQRIMDSIDRFRDLMVIFNRWGANGSLGFVLDTNLFQTSDKENLSFQDDITGLSGFGYQASAKIWRYVMQGRASGLSFGYDVRRLGWIKKALHEVDQVDQKIYSEYYFGRRKWLRGRAYIQTLVLGSERALDGLILENNYRYQDLSWQPELIFDLGVYKDPVPSRADIIDPLSGDLQGVASDRSSRLLRFGFGGRAWQQPRQEFNVRLIYLSRTFTNDLVAADSYSSTSLELEYLLRFWGLSVIDLDLSLGQKVFPDATTSRTDIDTKFGVHYRFDMEHDGNFKIGISQESRDSDDPLQKFSKYHIVTAIQLEI
ncbi:tetratricopeptide repeat protein [Pseudobacteriovorax antillogorgiicola]|uniref:Uncharacterized protein n=1 Tax=Pseudobacteriovorax antillogorgiicola TaxID=1513793 RepID=A0A1Y6BC46_9BACT|nr:hypothetical protein [Pseudobacteriovorax antillogorgiicola]TCS58591.1 hypothetical protein EDD56_102104 [Pseudobacteriovorax antillogorgiicola]SME97138.1 hypothetical protein SAMN06296036_102339 [Pseudobacteriovorax antillogorgiicola]